MPDISDAFKKNISVIYLACLQYYLTADTGRWTMPDMSDAVTQNAGLSGVTAGLLLYLCNVILLDDLILLSFS